MKIKLIVLFLFISVCGFSQFNPTFDTVRFYRGLSVGSKIYYVRISGDTLFLNSDTLLTGSSAADSSLWELNSNDIYPKAGITSVGIGTTNPHNEFHIYATSPIMEIEGTTDDAYIYLNSATDGLAGADAGIKFQGNSANKWYMGKNNAEDYLVYDYTRSKNVLYIVSNGDMSLMEGGGLVGIGTTTPTEKLDVVGGNIQMESTYALKYPDTLLARQIGGNYLFGSQNAVIAPGAVGNTFMGYKAGNANINGAQNTFIGYNSGLLETNGAWNVGVGYGTLAAITTATDNVAVGYLALNLNTSSNNTAINLSLQNNTTGSDNIGIGVDAGSENISGSYNVMIGGETNYFQTTGSKNVLIGYQASRGGSTPGAQVKSNNTIIGYQSGYNLKDGDTNCVMLGYQSGYNEAGSDKLYIENSNSVSPLIYGNFATDSLAVNGKLTISDMPKASKAYFVVTDDEGETLSLMDTNILFRGATASDIHDSLVANSQGFLTSESDPVWLSDSSTYSAKSWVLDQGFLTSESDPVWLSDSSTYSSKSWVLDQGFLTSESDPVWLSDSSTYASKSYVGDIVSDTNNWINYSNKLVTKDAITRVGVGTSSPDQQLHIESSDPRIQIEDSDDNSYLILRQQAGGFAYINELAPTGDATIKINPIPQDGTSNAVWEVNRTTSTTGDVSVKVYKGDGSATINCQLGSNTDSYFNANTGNVGIGTTSPSEKLEVNGKTKTTTFQMTNGATNGYALISDVSGNGVWTSLASFTPSGGNADSLASKQANFYLDSTDFTTIYNSIHDSLSSNVPLYETDPVWLSDSSTYSAKSWVLDQGFLTSESDPVWVSDSSTYAAKSWVEDKGYLTSESDPVWLSDSSTYSAKSWVLDQGFLTSETDPQWVSDSSTYAAKSWVLDKGYLDWTDTSNQLATDYDLTLIDHNTLVNYLPEKHYFQKDIDTINTGLSGILVGTSGLLSAITDNSATWNTAIVDGDFTSNGLMTRTAAGTYESRSITGTTNEVTVLYGDGVSTDPTISLVLLKDLVTNAPLSGGEDNILIGANTDITLSIDTTSSVGVATQYDNSLKQDISDTSTVDATRYWVTSQSYLDTESDPVWISDSSTYSAKSYVCDMVSDTNFWVNYSNKLVTKSSITHVGIGTNNPNEKLHVCNGYIAIDSLYAIKQNTNILIRKDKSNIFIGSSATSTGNAGVFIGQGAGSNNNNTADHLIAIGWYAGQKNTSGVNNTFIGESAGKNNTTGQQQTAIGSGACENTTTGSYNTALGFTALGSNTTGSYNIAIGGGACASQGAGVSNNTAVGYTALYSNLSGSNVAFGYQAGYSHTVNSGNSFIGYQADYYNQQGAENTIIGYQAGKGSSLHNKSGNVFIGYQSGFSETGSNKLYIENSNSTTPLIYGDFSSDYVLINGCFTENNVDTIEDGDLFGSIMTLGRFNNIVFTSTATIDSISIDSAIPNLTTFTILFTNTASSNGIDEGGNIKLAGSFAYRPDDILVLQRFGNIFYEKSRSSND